MTTLKRSLAPLSSERHTGRQCLAEAQKLFRCVRRSVPASSTCPHPLAPCSASLLSISDAKMEAGISRPLRLALHCESLDKRFLMLGDLLRATWD